MAVIDTLTGVDTSHIKKDFDEQKGRLEQQITILDLRLQELHGHILTIEAANNHLQQLIHVEKDPAKKGKFYQAVRNNIELLAKLYSVYREFEDTKFKYNKEISDIIYNKHKLIDVDIRRINEKIEGSTNELGDILKLVMSQMRELPLKDIGEKIKLTDPSYKL